MTGYVTSPPGATWDADRAVFLIKETDTHLIEVLPFIHTAAIVTTPKRNTFTYDDRWCYEDVSAAVAAAVAWNPEAGTEPAGWHRHPATGRRRPDGDATREYVNP